jgi:hypothetical protein
MPREVWMRVKPPNAEPVVLDLGTTALQSLSEPNIYGVAKAIDGPEYRVSVYRPDLQDAGKGFPINADHYRLWEAFPSFLDLGQIVNRCTTSLDPNLAAYINERVFLIKERPGDDHWLRDYPSHVRLLVESAERR